MVCYERIIVDSYYQLLLDTIYSCRLQGWRTTKYVKTERNKMGGDVLLNVNQ